VEVKEKLLNPKLDGLQKHFGRQRSLITHPRIAMGNYYQINQSQHQKNERIHTIQGPHSIVQLMINGGRAEKIINMFNLWQCSTY
jgi:hypothetical protein